MIQIFIRDKKLIKMFELYKEINGHKTNTAVLRQLLNEEDKIVLLEKKIEILQERINILIYKNKNPLTK
ncbi:hypothetical protein FIA58_009110 [Flavobacterium jejuense]|uniref:HTH merR-type domain-containing protein n=1 Tax=Flavobacterium jejuense TaxID=1544455 RepID=A0ABX0IRI4_9FLAO|nr:hypothetical protein [Flavobacterium jejuense]NHN25831.1 hypothetical protein [Flavobacterium jejuense]